MQSTQPPISGSDVIGNVATVYLCIPGKDKKGKIISVTPATTIAATKVLDPQYINKQDLTPGDVTGYKIKGFWYFDKRQGELKYRLLAIAPMGKDVLTLGLVGIEDDALYELFWVFYPSARQVLHDAKVFNPKNVSQPISFMAVFVSIKRKLV